MSSLGPGIRKIQMKTENRLFRDHIPDAVLDLHAQQSQISDSEPKRAPPGFPHSAQQSLDTEKVPVWKSLCSFHQKLSRTGTQINLDRLIIGEDFRPRQGRKKIC